MFQSGDARAASWMLKWQTEKEVVLGGRGTQLNELETAGTMVRKDTLTGTKMHGVRHKNVL